MRCMALWIVALAATACGTSNGKTAPEDAAAPADACSTTTSADFIYPAGPYGTGVGDRFQDLSLPDCDGQSVRFAEVLAGADLVLFNVAAGWCGPCVAETQTLEVDVYRAFCGRGLRVVQVLFEDENGAPAAPEFCGRWRDRFGLTFPVLMDKDFVTKALFPGTISGSTPLNLLVDRDAVIRYRSAGPTPPDFHQRIEELLP